MGHTAQVVPSGANDPAAHAEHVVPMSVVPAAQIHSDAALAPGETVVKPLPHDRQLEAPADAAYVATGQAEHELAASAANEPAPHGVHAAPTSVDPAAHTHADAEMDPVFAVVNPVAQAEHVAAPAMVE